VFIAGTTYNSTDITAAGFWAGYGAGGRGGYQSGMRVGDILMHVASTGSAVVPGRVTMHSVIASSANVASTILSSGYNAAYDVTVASAT
jgi:hypothetical protein